MKSGCFFSMGLYIIYRNFTVVHNSDRQMVQCACVCSFILENTETKLFLATAMVVLLKHAHSHVQYDIVINYGKHFKAYVRTTIMPISPMYCI